MHISVLGLGIIGGAWAKNLIADGHTVGCWNRTPKDFPNFHASVAEAVEGAEAIFLVVADPPAVQGVLDQLLPALKPGQIVIQSSTISAEWTERFALQVEKTGALFLEGPFTGSKAAAENRQTVFYLGGPVELIEKARPFLQPLSKSILHIGPRGTASALKLAMNLNIAGVTLTLSESFALARAAGIPDDIYFAALGQNVSHSGVADRMGPKLRAADYTPQFSLKHMAKDLRLALETAHGLSVPLEQTAHLRDLYERGLKAGWAEDDFTVLMRLIRQDEKVG